MNAREPLENKRPESYKTANESGMASRCAGLALIDGSWGDIGMKAFLAAVAFSVVTACVWYGVLDMQQRPAADAFAAPSSVRL